MDRSRPSLLCVTCFELASVASSSHTTRQDYFDEAVLFNTFWQLGMGLTHMEIAEIMAHYDIDGDGKVSTPPLSPLHPTPRHPAPRATQVNFYSFVTELLQLPHMGPREVLRGPRPQLSERVRGYMAKLRKELERAAARPPYPPMPTVAGLLMVSCWSPFYPNFFF